MVKSTLQSTYFEALSAWTHSGARRVTDAAYTPLDDIQIVDVVMRGNYTLDRVQPAGSADNSTKFLATRGTLLDNVESSANNGPGFWFDTQNSAYTVRNSYFHDNKNIGGSRFAGRGLNLEANWAPGLVERNVFANNASVGLAITNSQGVTVRDNLFVNNTRCVELTNTARGNEFTLRDVVIADNACASWTDFAAIHTVGDFTTPSAMGVRADGNRYEAGSVRRIARWENRAIGGAETIGALRTKFG